MRSTGSTDANQEPEVIAAVQTRLSMLSALEAAGSDWWIDEQVVVPRVALDEEDRESDEAIHGTIVDWEYDEGADESFYSLELDNGLDSLFWLTPKQLAGVEGFGPHHYAVECRRLDRSPKIQGKSVRAGAAHASAGSSTKKCAKKGSQPGASGSKTNSAIGDEDADDPIWSDFTAQLDSETTAADASKMRQGWTYNEYTGDRVTAREQPPRESSGVRHPKLRGRGADACLGKLLAIECQDCTSPPTAMQYLHQQLLTYAAGDVHQGGTRRPFDWMRRSRRPAPGLGEVWRSISGNRSVLYLTPPY